MKKILNNRFKVKYTIPIIFLIGLLFYSGITACCNGEKIQYCLHFILNDACEACEGGAILSTTFYLDVGDERKVLNDFGTEPWEICILANENGGESITALLFKICTDNNGHQVLQTCLSEKNLKTPKACDYARKDVYVPLYCSCTNIPGVGSGP